MSSYSLKNMKLRAVLFVVLSVAAIGGIAWWCGLFSFLPGVSLLSKGPIQPYRPEDRAAIMQLLKDDWYWLVSEGAVDFSPDYMLDHHAATYHYTDNSLSIDVYRTPEGKVAGFVTYHPIEGYKGRIQFLAVGKEFRKKGYAKELMAHAINRLKKAGMCFIEIAVRSHNTPAFTLYKRFGFKEMWSSSEGFVGMGKSLCGSGAKNMSPAPVDF